MTNGQARRLYGQRLAPVDLRGLGPVRTLTLVDGERFAVGVRFSR
jgi:hypothetical protein